MRNKIKNFLLDNGVLKEVSYICKLRRGGMVYVHKTILLGFVIKLQNINL